MEKTKLVRNAPHQKYHLADGTQVAGGSTICKIGDDPAALIHWAWNLGREGKDYKKERDKAADIGTIAHFLIECFLNNQVADLSDYEQEDIDKALMCYNKFVDWWDEQSLEKVATEIQLVNEKHRYGGTIDLIARSTKGEYILIDFKTSKRISESYWRQCAGYAQLWNCNQPKASKTIDGKECKHIVIGPYQVIPDGVKIDVMESVNQITNHAIVRIGKQDEGDFEVVWKDDLSKEWFVFQKQVDLYWAMQAAKPEPKPRGRKKK
jgi:hypothetical protein